MYTCVYGDEAATVDVFLCHYHNTSWDHAYYTIMPSINISDQITNSKSRFWLVLV